MGGKAHTKLVKEHTQSQEGERHVRRTVSKQMRHYEEFYAGKLKKMARKVGWGQITEPNNHPSQCIPSIRHSRF